MNAMQNWLEKRTGLVGLARKFLYDPIPGGARWRYTWISMLLFSFFVQVVTGMFMLTHYSASTQTAWESIFFLQYLVPGGAILRGLHVISAQVFVVLLVIHLFQTIVFRAHLAPREIAYWLLLLIFPLAIGMSVTGWLLPFDQKGYWAARVPLNILSIVPLIGPELQKLLIGGTEISHLTLTRFTALHTVILPLVLGTVLVLHWVLTHKHGLAATAPKPGAKWQSYWPYQALRDVGGCVVLVVLLGLLVFRPWQSPPITVGAELLAPADPSEPFAAARPEWFMLWLFQFLKLFPGGTEIWGAVIIPTLVFMLLAGLPWITARRGGQTVSEILLGIIIGSAIVLGVAAWHADRDDANYQTAVMDAHKQAERVKALARGPTGISPLGALSLLHQDPLTQGPRLFARHCASCHRFDGHNGEGHPVSEPQSASDLKAFASREWLSRFLQLEHLTSTNYFGGTKFANGKMVRFVRKNLTELSAEESAQLEKMILAVSAEAQLPSQAEADARDAAAIAAGRELINDADFACTDCHTFRKPDEDATAPDLTGYGSRDWLVRFISNPSHPLFYGSKNDRMPAYGEDGILDEQSIGLLADWMRGDWYEPEE